MHREIPVFLLWVSSQTRSTDTEHSPWGYQTLGVGSPYSTRQRGGEEVRDVKEGVGPFVHDG